VPVFFFVMSANGARYARSSQTASADGSASDRASAALRYSRVKGSMTDASAGAAGPASP